MWATERESRSDIVCRYRRVWKHSDATVANLALDAAGRVAWWQDAAVPLFNTLVHLLAETSRHAGHADTLADGCADARACTTQTRLQKAVSSRQTGGPSLYASADRAPK